MKSEIRNAKISSTSLGHIMNGIASCFLTCEGDGWGCGFGGYALDEPIKPRTNEFRRQGSDYGMEFILRILTTLGVERWEQLKGQHIRVDIEGLGGGILGIGHIVEDRWFYPKRDLAYLIESKREAAHG